MIIDTIEDDAEPQEALDDSEKFLPETLESEPNGESISLERLLSAKDHFVSSRLYFSEYGGFNFNIEG